MRKLNVLFFVLFLSLAFAPAASFAKSHHTSHHRSSSSSQRSSSAPSYADIVIDAETGRIIHSNNATSLRHPASLTKMMTLYLTFQALEAGRFTLGQYIPVSEYASYQSPSKLGLRAGQQIRVEDAILGLVTQSANDAAVVLGEAMGGNVSAFAQIMTRQARALGMSSTVFRNPSGLPDDQQVTSARDMAILGSALINHYPQYYPYFSHEGFTFAGIYRGTHNHLMERYDGMDGIKTGYIRASGFNLVASAKQGNTRLIGVVFGGRSAVARDNQMAKLLDNGFSTVQAENRSGHVEATRGEGDDDGASSGGYIPLPAKVAAAFPPRGNALVPAQRPAVVQTPAVVQPQLSQDTGAQPQQNAAQETPRPATKPAPRSTNKAAADWGIQVGAFSDAAVGQQAISSLMSSLSDMLQGGDAQVQPVSAGGTTMYRARVMSLDKKTAQNVCSYLIQRGKSCLTVQP